MSKRTLYWVPVVLSIVSCSDFTGLDLDDLAGTWNAVSAVATNPAMESQTEDLIALGFDVQFIIDASGALEVLLLFGEVIDRSIGTISIDESAKTFEVLIQGRSSTGTIVRQGDAMRLDILTGIEWTFTGTGFDVPVTLAITLLRE